MLQYSTVRVNITSIVVDGIDADDIPDDTPLTGTLELAPMIAAGSAIQYDDGGETKLKMVTPVNVDIGLTGDISHQGRDYVKILAPTSSTTNLAQLQWRATFKALRYGTQVVTVNPIYFYATPGAEINLADHVNVAPTSLAVQLSRGPRGFGVGEVIDEAGDFVFKLDDDSGTEVGRVAIPEGEVSDAAVAELVASETETTTAVDARVRAVGDGTYAPLDAGSTSVTYNPNGSVASVTESGITTSYGYNTDGSIASDARLDVLRLYVYDGAGNLVSIGAGEPAEETFTYSAGALTSHTRAGITTTYTYGIGGQVATETTGGVTKTYTYDGSGNLTGIASA